LALGVHLAHEHGALEAEQRRRRGRRPPVLPCPGLRDDAPLAHAPREERLAHHVVDLVRAGVRQVLALEQHAHAQLLRESSALGDRRGTPGVVCQQIVELPVEFGISPRLLEGLLEIEAGRHQGLGNEASPEFTEAPVGTGLAHKAAHVSRQSYGSSSLGAATRGSRVSTSSAAARALTMKSRTFNASLRPGADSTPDETSTPYGRRWATAWATLRGFRA